jgi:hypothetical protein
MLWYRSINFKFLINLSPARTAALARQEPFIRSEIRSAAVAGRVERRFHVACCTHHQVYPRHPQFLLAVTKRQGLC